MNARRAGAVVVAWAVLAGAAAAQDRSGWAPAIEDNSFLIEEAYNQEEGVVQHIGGLLHYGDFDDLGFTQEWPVGSQKHQLSYSIRWAFPEDGSSGFGDALVNYRYQLKDGSAWAAIAPRVSLIVPTGDEDKGLGDGKVGVQFNLPVSRRAASWFAWHLNAGGTVLEDANAWHVGGSGILLITPKVNAMLEVLHVDGAEAAETIVNPGLRAAIDVGSLQIVPGISVPITWSDGDTDSGVFFYLSFEHPF